MQITWMTLLTIPNNEVRGKSVMLAGSEHVVKNGSDGNPEEEHEEKRDGMPEEPRRTP